MKPHLLLSAELSQLRQRIDGSCRSRTGCANDHQRSESTRTIFSDLGSKSAKVHLQISVGRYHSNRSAPQAYHVSNFAKGMMCFSGKINHGSGRQASETFFTVIRKCTGQSSDDSREVGLRSTAGKGGHCIGWQAKLAGKPAKCVSLNFIGCRSSPPGRKLRIVS